MKKSIPPLPPIESPYEQTRPDDSFRDAVFKLMIAYDGVADVDEMRSVLEEVLMRYYELHGDGTAGRA